MKKFDSPSLDLAVGVMALMNSASGNIEDLSRSVLNAVACFLQNQGLDSECGNLNSIEGIARGAAEEYKEVLDYRAYMDARTAERAADPNRYTKPIAGDLVMKSLRKEITREEMYRLNDERLAAEEAAKVPAVCSECQGQRYIHNVCDQGHYGHSTPCEKCNEGGN